MKGFTTNNLKIIAIIAMIIDHIGFYFYDKIPYQLYINCRIIGRIAMPIFAFLILQGIKHTKSKKKYILRLFILAIITQIAIYLMYKINISYYKNYSINIINYLNIVFSFALSVLIIQIIELKIKDSNILIFKILINVLKILLIILILSIYFVINIDYSFYVPLMIIIMYFIDKILSKYNKDILEKVLICITIVVIGIINQKFIGLYTILSFPFILFYNGKLGKKANILKYSFYAFFPLHHMILYFISMLASK